MVHKCASVVCLCAADERHENGSAMVGIDTGTGEHWRILAGLNNNDIDVLPVVHVEAS